MSVERPREKLGGVTAGDKWYADWQHPDHVPLFDGRSTLSDRELARNYESFNDVRLLKERVDRSRDLTILEVGCATGEFSRYLRITYPRARYYGIDVSRSAIARAREKYPHVPLFAVEPSMTIADALHVLRVPRPEFVYSKDVAHHQTNPFPFISELVSVASEAVILRTRTRDVGETVGDAELSCQYHYDGWVPYIVMNLEELIHHLRSQVPACELVICRNHMVLGGRENRYLPKECYLPETGTAETVVGIVLKTERPGQTTLEDRTDRNLEYPLGYRVTNFARRLLARIAFLS